MRKVFRSVHSCVTPVDLKKTNILSTIKEIRESANGKGEKRDEMPLLHQFGQ